MNSQEKKKILLLDDEIEMLNLISTILSHQNIVRTTLAQTALRISLEKSFDLVISDINFMGQSLNGLDVYSIYRKLYPETPYIFVSGSCEKVSREIRDDPHLVVIQKPFHLGKLKCFMEYFLQNSPWESIRG